MEYLLIIGLTFLLSWSIIKISNKKRLNLLTKVKYRQSDIYELVRDSIPKKIFDMPKIITQSQKHIQKNMLKVVITNGKAYWISNDVFYSADSINGRIDEETIKQLDFENMSKDEMVNMLSILDDLKKGTNTNDSGGTGNKTV